MRKRCVGARERRLFVNQSIFRRRPSREFPAETGPTQPTPAAHQMLSYLCSPAHFHLRSSS